jgi:hypothetical protein
MGLKARAAVAFVPETAPEIVLDGFDSEGIFVHSRP